MRGTPALLNGELTKPLRTEAEARKDILRMRRAGETFVQLEQRLNEEARARFDLAISSARSAMEDANMTPADLQRFDDYISDCIGDTWEALP